MLDSGRCVIVVDACRSRSTNLGRDAYILIIALDIIITIRSSINCPTIICLPTMCYFSREATSEIFGPRVYYVSYLLSDLLFATFIFRSIIPTQIPCYTFYLHLLFRVLSRAIYTIYHKIIYLFTVEGLATPLTRRVASICSLCAGNVCILLLGSPNGLIPWFYN